MIGRGYNRIFPVTNQKWLCKNTPTSKNLRLIDNELAIVTKNVSFLSGFFALEKLRKSSDILMKFVENMPRSRRRREDSSEESSVTSYRRKRHRPSSPSSRSTYRSRRYEDSEGSNKSRRRPRSRSRSERRRRRRKDSPSGSKYSVS